MPRPDEQVQSPGLEEAALASDLAEEAGPDASTEDIAPDFFAAPDDAPLADDGALPEDGALLEYGVMADDVPAELAPQGLRWSWELDFDALVAALSEPAPWNRPARPAPKPTSHPPGGGEAARTPRTKPVTPPRNGEAAPTPPTSLPGSEPDPVQDASAAVQPDSEPAGASMPDQLSDQDSSRGPAIAGSDPNPVLDPGASAGGVDLAEAEFAEIIEAMEAGRSRIVPLAAVAGRVAESLPAGPDLAGWLGTGEASGLEDGALAGVAASYRRLASWAQAGELAVIAELAARSAAADRRVGLAADGRPAQLTDDACAQVSLALTMSQAGASWWADLAVTLTWRLAATGAALRTGEIDLGRARLIAEATAVLDEDTARIVEAAALPRAGDQTTGQLRAALRRAVIAADPDGAERRREEAERRAKVSLYPDPDGTASLAGYSLPAIRAAAAMARISALAKAMKATGAGGGIDRLRAQVFLGLLLGTLPYIPPAEDAPPDQPPDDDPGEPPGDDSGRGPVDDCGGDPSGDSSDPSGDFSEPPPDGRPADQPTRPRPGSRPPDYPPASPGQRRRPDPGRPEPHAPADSHDRRGEQRSAGDRDGPAGRGITKCGGSPERNAPRSGITSRDGPETHDPGPAQRESGGSDRSRPPKPRPEAGPAPPEWDSDPAPTPPEPDDPPADDLPAPADLPPPGDPDHHPGWASQAHDDVGAGSPPPAWPPIPPALPPGPPALAALRPAQGGLLDLTVPWSTLIGDSGQPGQLTRIGPITPGQARHLAELAATDPAIPWKAIVTSPDGTAIGVARVPRLSVSTDCQRGPDARASLLRQVSVTICPGQQTLVPESGLPMIYQRTFRAAARAAELARLQALADAAADGCAHTLASTAYQPPPLLREYITARDGTCRFPTCRQPAWRCDLDHCVPFHMGGRTCRCNLGGLCRFHHLLKQHRLWQLIQPAPGTFAWITPTGRTYYVEPDAHAA